MGRSRGKAYW